MNLSFVPNPDHHIRIRTRTPPRCQCHAGPLCPYFFNQPTKKPNSTSTPCPSTILVLIRLYQEITCYSPKKKKILVLSLVFHSVCSLQTFLTKKYTHILHHYQNLCIMMNFVVNFIQSHPRIPRIP